MKTIMKRNIIGKVAFMFIALCVFTSCNDLFNEKDIQQNPNAPLEDQVGLAPLTTGTLALLGSLHEDTDTRIAFMWSGQLAGQSRQQAGYQAYIVSASTFAWTNYYNIAQNARIIQKKATVVNNKVAIGLAQVVEAMVFMKLTALWGDVPYSEAFDDINHPTPKYDGQLALYNTLIELLNTAYANLGSGVGSIPSTAGRSADFMFNGSVSKWRAAAMTLQARLYLHLKDYTNAIASASIGISSSANDMLMLHGSAQAIDWNMNFDFFDTSRPGDTSFDPPAYLPKFMCTDLATGTFTVDQPIRNSKTDETGLYYHFFQYAAESNSGLDPNTQDGMYVQDAPHPLVTYYENQLIIAESKARLDDLQGGIDALNNVRQGLASGFINGLTSGYGPLVFTDYDLTDLQAGGTLNPNGTSSAADQKLALLTEIASEKFIIMIGQYEAFNELRRLKTTSPAVDLHIPIANNTFTNHPTRFIYPQNEVNTNPNVPKVNGEIPDLKTVLPIFQ